MELRWFLFAAVLVTFTRAVDRDVFRTCGELDFCSRLRNASASPLYLVDPNTVSVGANSVSVNLINNSTQRALNLTIYALVNDSFRVTIDEVDFQRYHLEGALDGEPQLANIETVSLLGNISISFGNGNKAVARTSPLELEFYKNDVLVAVLNGHDRFVIESSNTSRAIAFLVEFPGALRTYGIPLHADQLSLRTTVGNSRDPYRLYNLDVAYYELDEQMALYGAVPILYGHGPSYTSGIFFHNAAEQWVDINNGADGVSAYFITDGGAFDVFVFLGPTPELVAQQYTSLTGVAPLPQYWAFGYHQCRWNYDSDEDVKYVIAELDNYDFPVDVIWLDIEYTDEKKYFTWDYVNFSDPLGMQANLSATNRKLVTIIDPHIKVEQGYFVYDGALENGFFVRYANGTVFEGDCWPGLSSYIDFFNPNASDYVSNLYSYESFPDSTPTLGGIWNDMNEPSVFDDSIEKTFPKDVVHFGGVEHKDVHNIYGFTQTRATYQGLLRRDNYENRPFVLTRSHFAGSQRYTNVWTGDNTADWGYLAVSYPQCLTEGLAGISFCGADVGGFFENPDEELVQRWYQAGVWLPFYRAHANMGTDRREPYLYSEEAQTRIRAALRQRYAHIPLFYTLFYEHYRFGVPVVRPLFYQYPEDPAVVDIDNQLLIGDRILVRNVAQPGVSSVNLYLPGGPTEAWYDIETPRLFYGVGNISLDVTLDSIPVFYRGGTIVARKDTPRRNTVEQRNDTYTVYIFADTNNNAYGTVYIDDQSSFSYQNNVFNYFAIAYNNGTLSLNNLAPEANYPEGQFVADAYIVYRPPSTRTYSEEPVAINAEKVEVTADGKKVSDIRFNPMEEVKVQLF